jgi:hypothetical protein
MILALSQGDNAKIDLMPQVPTYLWFWKTLDCFSNAFFDFCLEMILDTKALSKNGL